MMTRLRLFVLAAVVAALAASVGGSRAAGPPYVAVDLGLLGGASVSASDVNDAGQVVGAVYSAGYATWHAFSWTQAGGAIDLGTLGGPDSAAQFVTDSGQVVGTGYTAPGIWHAFSWTQAGGIADLGTLGGTQSSPQDVNDYGQVVGLSNWSSYPPPIHAFSWTQAGGMVDLGTLGGTGSTTAWGMNDAGWVAGTTSTLSNQYHAYLWTPADGMVDLGTLGGSMSSGADVNGAGQVVGYSTTASGEQHAFSWTQARGMVDLGTLGGTTSSASIVNDSGQVVGTSTTASGAQRVFSWTPSSGMVDIGTLGGANAHIGGNSLRALNNAGQVVGWSDTADGASHAFVWTSAGGMVDLGTLGGTYSSAAAVSDHGLIVGSSGTASGESHGVLWKPATPPPTAQVSVIRTRRVLPDASVDSMGADQPTSAMLTWSATLSNTGSDVLPAPRISVDGSSWTFVPPVTFPLSVAGADLQQNGMLNLTDLQGANHSHAVADNVKTGFDSARTMSPATLPPGGGTQTVTVTATLRDPATVGDSLSIQVGASDPVPGAAIDVQSVVPPTTDPGSGAYVSVDPGGHSLWWSLPSPALNTTYTLTLQITVPNAATSGLRYKPTVMVSLAEPRRYFPEETGLSTTIPDATLGGTFTFSAGSAVDWMRRIVYSLSYVTFAPVATAADTTPPVLSLPADETVEATGPTGAVVSFAATAKDDVDPSPTVSCTPPSGSMFAIGTTTVSCTATDASGNSATGSFTITVKGAGEQLAELAAAVKGVGPGKSLVATVEIAQWFAAHGQTQAVCLTLTAFNLEVRAQSGKKIPAAQAAELIADANRIKSVLGCKK